MIYVLHFQATQERSSLPARVELPIKKGRRRKSLAMKFAHESPFIEVPSHLPPAEIYGFLQRYDAWLHRAYRKWHSHAAQQTNTESEPGRVSLGCTWHTLNSVLTGQLNQAGLGKVELFGKSFEVFWEPSVSASAQNPVNAFGGATSLPISETEMAESIALNASFWKGLSKALGQALAVNVSNMEHLLTQLILALSHQSVQVTLCSSRSQILLRFESPHLEIGEYLWSQTLADGLSEFLIHWVLGQFYQRQTQRYLASGLPIYAQQMGLRYSTFSVKAYKARWGSCKSDGSLQFNWRILQAPKLVVDYLMVHELAHLQHPNHSKAYWALVESYFPQVKSAKLVLKQNGARWISFLDRVY